MATSTTARKMQVNDRSTVGAGLPTEFNDVIAQYIWNAFEADATSVDICFDATSVVGHLNTFSIVDNGSGINHEKLDDAFGFFLDSPKKRNKNSSLIRGGKGKGRLSFNLFSSKVVWHTTYSNEKNALMDYDITILSGTKDYYDPTDLKKSDKKNTGTEVEFLSIDRITIDSFTSDEFTRYLKRQFGWFLHLNKDKGYQLRINGIPLVYSDIIKISKKYVKKFTDEDTSTPYTFTIDYMQWNEKIGEQNYFYYLNSGQSEVFKDFTSFNKTGGGAYGFYHSVYVTSDFFDNFDVDKLNDTQTSLLANCKGNSAFKQLVTYLKDELLKERKEFYKESADKLWQGFERKKTIPSYSDTPTDQIKKESLKQVVENLYTIEPNIFIKLNPEQEKTMLGLMDLVLDTDEKNNVMKIVDGLVNDLSPEDRKDFADLLDQVRLDRVSSMLKLIVSREKVVSSLKKLVFTLKKFTTERDHIQKAIENSTWLFGEEFTNVSFDKDFEESLRQYSYILDGFTEKEIIADPEKKRRTDVFLCRQRPVSDTNYGNLSQLEENMIIELKRPNVTIGTKELRQVEDYRNIIKRNKQFHSQMKVWKFFVVSSDVDNEVKDRYKSFADKGRRFLVDWQDDFEIYAMTWSDIFDIYRIRNKFLLDRLQIDKSVICKELEERSAGLSKEATDELTSLIVDENMKVLEVSV